MSDYIGVTKVKDKWLAKSKRETIGTFDTELEAAKSYDAFTLLKYQNRFKTNNLVTIEELQGKVPEDFQNIKQKRELPKYIKQQDNGKYYILRKYKDKIYTKRQIKTLEEAIKELEILNSEIEELQKIEIPIIPEIQYNSEKIPIIPIRNKKHEITDYALVDEEKWQELNKYRWYIAQKKVCTTINERIVSMNNMLIKSEYKVRYINGNNLDNRMSNLKEDIKKDTEITGINFIDNKWQVDITYDTEKKHIGLYESRLDAIFIYNYEAEQLYTENSKKKYELTNIDDPTIHFIPLFDNYKEIEQYAFIDLEDIKKVENIKWYPYREKTVKYPTKYYAQGSIPGSVAKLSHVIAGKPPKDHFIDHINGNSLDNRKSNLRIATIGQNGQSKTLDKKDRKNEYTGITHLGTRYFARCGKIAIGSYGSAEDAGRAYDLYVLTKYGEHAQTNKLAEYSEVVGKKPEDFIQKKEARELPTNINYDKNGKYVVKKRYKVKTYNGGTYETVEEALKGLEELNKKFEKMKLEESKKINELPIEYNEDGIPIIPIKNKDKEIVGYTLVDKDRWHELIKLPLHYGHKNYPMVYVNSTNMFLHKYILHVNDSKYVDHINHNKLDNRISNLREATGSQNSHSKKKKEDASSQYNGVSRKNNKWSAYISKDGKKTHIGLYENELEAAEAYNKKAIELYGDFAKLNT